MQPNVVIVVADTTRADDAYRPDVAPTLAELADAGTRATRAFAAAPWTLPSHASLLTGTAPSTHGAHADHELLDDRLPTLPECFREAGYETACVSNNTWLSVESGFDRGFETFHQMWQLVQSQTSLGELVQVTEEGRLRSVARQLLEGNPLANLANLGYGLLGDDQPDGGAERTTEWIADWLRERDDDRPFFLLANYLEPHLEYQPPRQLAEQFLPEDASYEEALAVPQEPWGYLAGDVSLSERDFRLLRGLYRAEIAYVDAQLGALRDALVDVGTFEDTIFVVTGDHGENVGDHGLMDHQYCVYDSLLHVPLVLHGGPFAGGGNHTDLVSLLDLAPTLLDAADVEAPDAREQFSGVSMLDERGDLRAGGNAAARAADESGRDAVVAEYQAPMPSMDALERHLDDVPDELYRFDRSLRAIRTDSFKLVRASDGARELYHVANDPGETTDVSAQHPDVVSDLEERLDSWLAQRDDADGGGEREEATMSEDRKRQLEELGYLQ